MTDKIGTSSRTEVDVFDVLSFFEDISSINLSELDVAELEDVTISLTKNFVILTTCFKAGFIEAIKFKEHSLNCIKYLKIICSKGCSFQNLIANTNGMLESVKLILESDVDEDVKLRSFQLLANLCVQNERAQKKLWTDLSALIMDRFNSDDTAYINVSAMIIYNIMLHNSDIIDKNLVLTDSLSHYDKFLKEDSPKVPDYFHILLEYFICEFNEIVVAYENLDDDLKKIFLYYLHDHVEHESNPVVSKPLLNHLSLEFKKKSDCVLKTVSNYVDNIDPEFVVILLDIISSATTHEKYLNILKDDRSLFLNIGCLLQALHKIGKKSDNVFTPIQKLEALAPTSSVSSDFEKEISFAFKSKLVKSLANLSYRNKKNQELAREMEIMHSIFECTTADARNPLIKEWSILAIRNLCEDNVENQEIVRSLTKVGNAENPVLSDFKLDDGIFRIIK